MKKTLFLSAGAAALLLLAWATPAWAAKPAKDVTVTGEAMCAKCAMHVSDKCQTVIQTKKDGKTVDYYIADNKVGKKFHPNICHENKKATATGTVAMVNGKEVLTPTKIALAK
jgi:nitrous oxide reductase accessory protein NosL